jgi:uncharacterized membrane protein YhaH (DUF805 family)
MGMDVNAIIANFRHVVTKQYVDFNGRTARAPFWYYVLAYIVLYIAASILDGMFVGGGFTPYGGFYYHPQPFTGLLALALLLPGLGISVRRLHDIDRSGWWILIGIIPIVGWLLLIYWYAQPGTKGANKFGAEPEAVPAAA